MLYFVLVILSVLWGICVTYLPISAVLIHWHWGNPMIATVPVKQSWRIWVKCFSTNHNKVWTIHIILGIYSISMHWYPNTLCTKILVISILNIESCIVNGLFLLSMLRHNVSKFSPSKLNKHSTARLPWLNCNFEDRFITFLFHWNAMYDIMPYLIITTY